MCSYLYDDRLAVMSYMRTGERVLLLMHGILADVPNTSCLLSMMMMTQIASARIGSRCLWTHPVQSPPRRAEAGSMATFRPRRWFPRVCTHGKDTCCVWVCCYCVCVHGMACEFVCYTCILFRSVTRVHWTLSGVASTVSKPESVAN